MCLILHQKKDYIRKLMPISVARHPESGATKNSMLLEKTKDRCKALMQIKVFFLYNWQQTKQKKNWAPSKIRLRLGAEVDVTTTIQIIIIEQTKIKTPETKHYILKEQQDWHLCCHKREKYRQAKERRRGYSTERERGTRNRFVT